MAETDAYAVPGRMPRQLADYWTRGKGAAKIRWGTPGDFDRCVRLLRRYFPRNPEGLCNRLHTRALGKPPGKHTLKETAMQPEVAPLDPPRVERDDEATERALVPMKTVWSGLIAPYDVPTGDRRRFDPGSLTARELPLPLLLQLETDDGHRNSVVVGRILELEHRPEGVWARGDFLPADQFPESARAVELLRAGVVGPSVDLDAVKYEHRNPDGTPFNIADYDACLEAGGDCPPPEMVVTDGRISAVTLVAIPAFAEARLALDEEPDEEGVLAALDAEFAAETDGDCGCDDALVASANSSRPPLDAFADPRLSGPTPLTVTDDGRVYGHLATWGTCHVGFPGACVTPPRSRTSYAYFHTGEVVTAEGQRVPVGKIVLGTPHADLEAGFRAAAQHYDDTGKAVAYVRAGEDEYGIWIAGVLAPGVDDETRATLAASPLSGDWRRIGGSMELIAALAVPVPGFPIARATAPEVAAALEPEALVAAGVVRKRPEPSAGQAVDVDAVAAKVAAAVRAQFQRETRATLAARDIERALAALRGARRDELLARIGDARR